MFMFSAPMGMAGRGGSSAVIDEIPQTPNPFFQSYSFDQTRIMNGISMLSGVQGDLITNAVHSELPLTTPACIADSNSSIVHSQGNNIVQDASLGTQCHPINSSEFQEQLAAGTTTITPSSLAAILAARFGLQEKPASLSPLEALTPYMLSNWQDTSNPQLPAFEDEVVPCTYSSMAHLDPNGWTTTSNAAANLTHHHAYASPSFRKELSLSLTTSPITSTSLSSDGHGNFSQAILGSRYLIGIQEILAQIARYSLENIEQMNSPASGGSRARTERNASSSNFTPKTMLAAIQNVDSMFETHVDSSLERQDGAESKKSQLLTLLQLV